MVPVPKSSLTSKGDLWVPYNLAVALVERGLGSEIVPCLKRAEAVQKAALSRSGTRPKAADHYRTIAVESVEAPGRAILVDDVVTTGATLIGAAEKMRSVFPDIKISAFVAMRTESSEFKKTMYPKVETITLFSSGKTHRE